jgi:lysozyme family protein
VPDVINAYCDKRLAFLQELKTWEHFGRGWGRRVLEVRRTALVMAAV